jgi:acetoacetyl-CoA synthetase
MSVSSAPLTANVPSETPLWTPSPEKIANARITAFAKRAEALTGTSFPDYKSLWAWSVADPAAFWSLFWDFADIIGDKGATILANGDDMEHSSFFPDGTLNWAENCLRRTDDGIAITFRAETGAERHISWADLNDKVARLQQALLAAGVGVGDRVAGFLPNMPEAVIGALATASIGAVWSSASPDFGTQGILDRFGQIQPKVLLAVDGYYYNGKALSVLDKISAVQPHLPTLLQTIIVPFIADTPDLSTLNDKSASLTDVLAAQSGGKPSFAKTPYNHPLFIMFSSGTTGIPKCIVHGHGGTTLQHMKEHQLQCDIQRDDRVFYYTTCGWMMWNWLISSLATGARLLLFDGSPFYPDGNALWDYAQAHKCTLFGTAAKYIDALKNHGVTPATTHDLAELRTLTSTGSPLVHESFDYIYKSIKQDLHVSSISGGTDIIACFVIGNPISPVWRGEIQGAGLGHAIDVFDDNGKPIPAGGGSGELVCTVPFASMPIGFWNDEDGQRYHNAYYDRFPNVWCHGDWIERTPHGGFIILGRSDATLNPGGVRIGTAEIYRQVEQIPEVLESIAVGQDWQDDVRVILFVRLKDGVTLNDDIATRIKNQIKTGASPRHVPARILQVTDIPRTKSGKIVELAVREVIHNRKVKNIEALANPEALDHLAR